MSLTPMISLHNNLINSTFKHHRVINFLKRFKKSSALKKYDPRQKALGHFDDFYKALFLHRWPSIRLGLLSKQKYVAVLNNFADVESTKDFLENQGAFDLLNFLQIQKEYVDESVVRSSKQPTKKVQLHNIIQDQVEQKEKLEMSGLHPEGEAFKLKVDSKGQEDDEEQIDVMYRPEDAMSSLQSDLLFSQIDFSRMIEPDSAMAQANLQEFIPATLLRGLEDYIPESEYYKYHQAVTKMSITTEKEYDLEIPEKLKVYTFDRGDITEFPEPFKEVHNVFSYLKVEGSDLLTTLALGIQPEDRVLDLCSYSGDMAYCIFQTLRPKVLVCVTSGRPHTEDLFRNCLYDYSPFWRGMLMISNQHLGNYENDELFDRILVNVPSTEDKLSVLEIESNIFGSVKTRERLKLPELQCSLLVKALKMVRPGGTVVYSTSTLSPVQNEGVVSAALTTAWETHKMEFTVKDLTPALKHTTVFYNLEDCLDMKYGTLVVPFAPANFGPKYFCKLVKKEMKGDEEIN